MVAVVLVLVLGQEEANTPTLPGAETEGSTVTDTVTPPAEGHGGDPAPSGERQDRLREANRVERAVAAYVEAAERGEVRAPGLPTSDELSVEGVYFAGRRAKAGLVGGAVLHLRKRGGRWVVVRVTGPTLRANPPSDGP